jgi:DHA3 family macrolide efflux protein-like MFS transporter
MALGMAVMGLGTVVLGLLTNFPVYLGLMAIMGISMPMYNTPAVVVLQTSVDPGFLGRVMSFFTMTSGAFVPLGMVIFGPMADTVSIDTLLVFTGIGMTLMLIPVVCSRELRAVSLPKSEAVVSDAQVNTD